MGCSSSVFQNAGESKAHTNNGSWALEGREGAGCVLAQLECGYVGAEDGPAVLLAGWLVLQRVPVRSALSWHGGCVP